MAGESQDSPSTGRPDPTVLTTEQMLLAVANLEKLVSAWRHADADRDTERFSSIKTQLELIERQRVEQKNDTKAAVDAALSAAKEAVREQTTASQLATNKTETSFAEQLLRQEATFTVAISGVTSSINDIKERISRMESFRQGGQDTRQEQRFNVNLLVGVGGFIVATLVAVIIMANALTGK